MKNYEIMFILKPTLSEDETKKAITHFKKVITENGGKVTEVNEMGQRELAYEIKKCKSGYYVVFEVESKDDKAIKEFDRLGLISSDMIRHLITKIEK